jgi:hypothetical protein
MKLIKRRILFLEAQVDAISPRECPEAWTQRFMAHERRNREVAEQLIAIIDRLWGGRPEFEMADLHLGRLYTGGLLWAGVMPNEKEGGVILPTNPSPQEAKTIELLKVLLRQVRRYASTTGDHFPHRWWGIREATVPEAKPATQTPTLDASKRA